MSNRALEYATRVVWEGNRGDGTAGYTRYGRGYRIVVDGKPVLRGSADPAFRGDADKHNPEELFVAALAACHMLFYLSLCARQGVVVLAYSDVASGTLRVDSDGGGRFEAITLRPQVTIARGEDAAVAASLHERAHALCFIANSCAAPIRVAATVQVQATEERA